MREEAESLTAQGELWMLPNVFDGRTAAHLGAREFEFRREGLFTKANRRGLIA